MAFTIFQANKKAKAAEVNANFAFIAGSRIIAIDASTGAPFATFPIGDLTAITNGSLAGDLSARSGKALKVYNASGTLLGSVSYDAMLNLQDASEIQKGVAEIATQTEANDGSNDTTFMTPLKTKVRQGMRYVGRLTASSTTSLSQTLSTGKIYYFEFVDIIPATDNAYFSMRYSTDGSTFISSNYITQVNYSNATNPLAGATVTDRINITPATGGWGLSSGAVKQYEGFLNIFNPSSSTTNKRSSWAGTYINSGDISVSQTYGAGIYTGSTAAVVKVQFFMSSGNIASGYIDVWESNA